MNGSGVIDLKGLVGAALCLSAWISPLQASAETGNEIAETAYLVKAYRYEAGASTDDADAGHALCGPRCNALSFDYVDYIMAGSWDIRKVAIDRELTVPLDNPFMKGHCICTVDEYQVKASTRNRPKTTREDHSGEGE